jgi:hypothetical protein
MKSLGITPQEWHEIRSAVNKDYAISGIDAHHEGILKDMFSGTHFSMQGINEQTATMRGTRPGDPVADILFNMAFKLVVVDARKRIMQSSDLQWFGSPQPSDDVTSADPIPAKGFAEITFVDDIAYAIHSTTAESVLSSLQIVASCLHDAAALTIKQARPKQLSSLQDTVQRKSNIRFGTTILVDFLYSLNMDARS